VQKSTLYFLLKQRRLRKNQKKAKNQGFASALLRGALASVLLVTVGLIFLGAWEYARITSNLPSADELDVLLDRNGGELLTPTRIYDRTGKVLLAELGNSPSGRQFLAVDPAAGAHFSSPLLAVATQVVQPDFWQSTGADLSDLADPHPHTIAERLVQSVLLSTEAESPLRGYRIRLLAAQVVHRYGRQQVLEWYLNSVYLGRNVFGVDAASRLYFGKSGQELTLAESALLVALMDAPALNPLDSPAASLELKQAVLDSLRQSGAIDAQEYRQAAAEALPLRTSAQVESPAIPAYVDRIAHQLEPVLGTNRLQRGGLTVVTTIDADLQSQLECTAKTQLFRIENSSISGVAAEGVDCPASLLLPTQNFSSQSFAGLAARGLIVDPKTGQVLAYLPPTSQFGDTLSDAPAQPGSLLSPVVALSGFARGASPSTLLWDIPASLPADLPGAANPDDAFHGPVSLRSAVANDYIVPIAQLAEQISPAVTWQMGSSLGLNDPLSSPPSAEPLFQGGEVSLLELAQVYATLANAGTRVGIADPATGKLDLNLVLTVKTVSQRTLVDRSSSQNLAIISESLAYLMNNVLGDDTARYPSLGYPNPLEIGRPSAAKIGQTQSGDQVWTAGYTPSRIVIIGIAQSGFEQGAASLQPVMAAGLWNAMIQYSSTDLPAADWARPIDISEVQVCSPSGLLPTDACPSVVREIFLAGNEPTYVDTLYQKVKINRETGLLATVFTPSDLVDEKVTLDVPPEARDWALAAGLPLTPTGYDAIQAASLDPQVRISAPQLFAPVSGKVEIRGTASSTAFKSYSIQVGEGINPSAWTLIGSPQTNPVTDGVLANWDTGGLQGLYAVRLNVVDQSNQVKTAVIQVTVDNDPPQAAILYPQPDTQVEPVNGVVTFNASAEDNIGVSRVEWWMDGKKIQETTSAPYYFIWQAVAGKHKLTLKAFDAAGNSYTTSEVSFTVPK